MHLRVSLNTNPCWKVLISKKSKTSTLDRKRRENHEEVMMTNIPDFSPHALVKAIETNLHAHLPYFGRMPRSTFWEEPGFKAVITALDPSECHVYLARFEPQDAEARIKQVLERYRSKGCLPMYWQVGPSTLPTDLGKYLEKCGFHLFAHPPGMVVELQKLDLASRVGNDFTVEPVKTGDQLRHWVNILATVDGLSDALREGFYQMFIDLGLEMGGISQLFLGMEKGIPVAGSHLFCAGDVAGIWHVSTLSEARGRGYGTAMTLTAAHAGLKLGYRVGVLLATPAGYPLYRRLGFEEVCHIDVYQSP
jgi:GNAT superfamily N-acetyltransferase